MPETLEDGSKLFTLDIPQREGKEGYIGTHFSLFLRIGGVLGDAHFSATDLRIEYMTHFLISLIPGRKNRADIRDRLRKDIDKNLTEEKKTIGENLTNEQIGRVRNMTCIEYMGEVMDFVDKHVGVSKENKIGFVVK